MRNESNNKLQQINTSLLSINNKLEFVGDPINWTLDSQIHCAKDCKSENVIAGKDDITFKSFSKDVSNITYDTYGDGYTTFPPYSILFQSATDPTIRYEVKATDTKQISIETKKVGNTSGVLTKLTWPGSFTAGIPPGTYYISFTAPFIIGLFNNTIKTFQFAKDNNKFNPYTITK